MTTKNLTGKQKQQVRHDEIISAIARINADKIMKETKKILNADFTPTGKFDPDNEISLLLPKNGERPATTAELAVIATKWNIDPEGIYCQKTGKKIGIREKNSIARMLDRFGLKHGTEIAGYLPLSMGVDPLWLFTQSKGENNLLWLQENDTPGYFVFLTDRCLRHLKKGWRKSRTNYIEMLSDKDIRAQEIHWQNSKIKAYELAKEYDKKHHTMLVAVTNVLDLIAEISPSSILWQVRYPHEMANQAYFDFISNHMQKMIYGIKLRFDRAQTRDIDYLNRVLKGHQDIKIKGKLHNESMAQQVDRIVTIFVPNKYTAKDLGVDIPKDETKYEGIIQTREKTKEKFKFNIVRKVS